MNTYAYDRDYFNILFVTVVDPPALSYIEYVADTTPVTQSPDAKKPDEQSKEKKEADKPSIGVSLR